jgi:ATP-binding cassette subfamily F protein 3
MLDEPTNHLDIPSRQALEESLSEYPGTCLIVSHDRRLLDRISTRTLWIDGVRTRVYLGGYTEARELREEELAADEQAQTNAAARESKQERASKPDPVLPKQKKINEFKLNAIETEIAALEDRKEKLSAALYEESNFRDGMKMREISADLDEIEKKLIVLQQEWEAVIDAAG